MRPEKPVPRAAAAEAAAAAAVVVVAAAVEAAVAAAAAEAAVAAAAAVAVAAAVAARTHPQSAAVGGFDRLCRRRQRGRCDRGRRREHGAGCDRRCGRPRAQPPDADGGRVARQRRRRVFSGSDRVHEQRRPACATARVSGARRWTAGAWPASRSLHRECAPLSTRCALQGNDVQTCNASGAGARAQSATTRRASPPRRLPGNVRPRSDSVPRAPRLRRAIRPVHGAPPRHARAGAAPWSLQRILYPPGATQCSGNGVQTCDNGQWGSPVDCGNQACVADSSGGASCQGVCAPNDDELRGGRERGLEQRRGDLLRLGDVGSRERVSVRVRERRRAAGVCVPGIDDLLGQRRPDLRSRTASGAAPSRARIRHASSGACVGFVHAHDDDLLEQRRRDLRRDRRRSERPSPARTRRASNGACVGQCVPGATQCSGQGVQTCDNNGNWGAAVACTNSACVANGGVASCQGTCSPGATQCSGNAACRRATRRACGRTPVGLHQLRRA